MNHTHSRTGSRIGLRALIYSIAFLAIIGVRETLTQGGGPLSDNLGRMFNKTLMTSSKLGLGLADMCVENSEPDSMIGRSGRAVGRVARKAFIDAYLVESHRK